MNYELAKQLKEAGFKQHGDNQDGYANDGGYEPTLSELIEACGGILVWGCKDHNYYASKQFCPTEHKKLEDVIEANTEGKTPEEAVAKLWLELNK
jgi:hypothetical protein